VNREVGSENALDCKNFRLRQFNTYGSAKLPRTELEFLEVKASNVGFMISLDELPPHQPKENTVFCQPLPIVRVRNLLLGRLYKDSA
jgi:hypothetical protein